MNNLYRAVRLWSIVSIVMAIISLSVSGLNVWIRLERSRDFSFKCEARGGRVVNLESGDFSGKACITSRKTT